MARDAVQKAHELLSAIDVFELAKMRHLEAAFPKPLHGQLRNLGRAPGHRFEGREARLRQADKVVASIGRRTDDGLSFSS